MILGVTTDFLEIGDRIGEAQGIKPVDFDDPGPFVPWLVVTMNETFRQIQRLFSQGTVTGLSDSALLRRFANSRDDAAFALLVSRHGPMVLGVCRGVLRDPLEAEDAFQATFLTLARQARSIWVEDSLGGWLHRVARRISVKANSRTIRRKSREQQGIEPDQIAAKPESEALPMLHDEIDRLPEADRQALVLCALEGLTQAQAAQVLGCGEATVRRRLARAKERLKHRLDRRGFPLPAPLGPSTVPSPWVVAASKLAIADATGRAIPLGVARLAGELAAVALIQRAALSLAAVGLTLGLVGYAAIRSKPEPEGEQSPVVAKISAPIPIVSPKPEPEPKVEAQDESVLLGQVLGPEGRPFGGASVFACTVRGERIIKTTTSDDEGRFRMGHRGLNRRFLTDGRVDGQPWLDNTAYIEYWPKLIAIAPGFGVGVAALGPGGDPVIRLVADEPVEGRVLDLQGQPVAGASVRVSGLFTPRQGDLTPWLDAVRLAAAGEGESENDGFSKAVEQFLWLLGRHPEGLSAVYPDLLPTLKTDAEGRFRIVGIGRERVAWVAIAGQGIESKLIAVATRPGLAPCLIHQTVAAQREEWANSRQDLTVVGTRFDHIAGPGRVVEGTVLDRETRAPIAGARVVPDLLNFFFEYPEDNRYQAVTDAQGRYRVEGLPQGVSTDFKVEVPDDQPFLAVERPIAAGRDPALPTVADFALERAVWVEGRVLDGSTGQPLERAEVHYHAFADNPHLPRQPEHLPDVRDPLRTGEDGRYRLAVYPGRGLLRVRSGSDGSFAWGIGADRIAGLVEDQAGRQVYPTVPKVLYLRNALLVAEVNPPVGSRPIALDLVLQKGRSREGRVIGPDGVELGELLAFSLLHDWNDSQKVEGNQIQLHDLSPGEERRVIVRADGPKLIGLTTLKPDENGPFEVRLVPWASLKGRLVDDAGKPLPKANLWLGDDLRLPMYTSYTKGCTGSYSAGRWKVSIDNEGRFLVEALIPDQPYKVEIGRGRTTALPVAPRLILKPGEAKDLGDVVPRKP